MNFKEIYNKLKKPILLNNFNIEIKNRYIPQKNKNKKREWFCENFQFNFENKDYCLLEVIIKFDHIDEDNPEFFLQPEQIIQIVKSKLEMEEYSENKYILTVYKFRQAAEK
ncbi:hypothetical protein CWO85_00650 [Candidatus Phytoplasma ziziphi]|uniref:Uncharacterized protein n=1 Tax=Ziziphus jujuba witches'-broom phytoplasma TaxID=135727 RepID=A0A660HME4_ZIZJU|nr:hypothetical protein [Candidatus Phytoplasma ziziphi]AYJ01049.1 hypothetical protein CWO85_00650 [Candidatus Phytoplasma ziziphi]